MLVVGRSACPRTRAPNVYPRKSNCQACSFQCAAIAQPVEHIIRNDGVRGSNPFCGTIPPPAQRHYGMNSARMLAVCSPSAGTRP